MNILGIVQARMASRRLPGKVLADVGGRPMLWHVVDRARQATRLNRVVVATSVNQADDGVEAFCVANAIGVYRGSEDDVLDRFYQTASAHGATAVARLTADCPLMDPAVIDGVVDDFETGGADYVSNTIDRTYPDGLDVEVCSFEALERAWREAALASEREHVTPYMWNHTELFTIRQLVQTEDLSSLRWTVDDPRDLALVRAICGLLKPDACRMSDILDVLRRHPELAGINAGIAINEGYGHSLARESQRAQPVVRPAEAGDAPAIWQIANDPSVRSKAFNDRPIPFDEHLRWFQDRLVSPRCRMWVVIDSGQIVAQVRYDKIDERVAEIDVAVAPGHRGEGLGPLALERTWRESCASLGATVVRGVVLEGNAPSERAFRKSGFDLAGKQKIHGRPCLLFERSAGFVENT